MSIPTLILPHLEVMAQVCSWFDGLTTNGPRGLEINYLAVRPELVEGRAADCDTVS